MFGAPAFEQDGIKYYHMPENSSYEKESFLAAKYVSEADLPKYRERGRVRNIVRKNPSDIKNIVYDETVKTREEGVMDALSANGKALKYLDESEQTENICCAAVESDGLALAYVKHQTWKICKTAVQQNPAALIFVSPKLLEEEQAKDETKELIKQLF